MERVLITGGAGFIGSALASDLIKRSKVTKSRCLMTYLQRKDFFVYGSTLDISALQNVVEFSDTVFHLAANPSRKDFDQNVIATYNLIEAMRKSMSCKKIVFASTSTVYGEVETQICQYPKIRALSNQYHFMAQLNCLVKR